MRLTLDLDGMKKHWRRGFSNRKLNGKIRLVKLLFPDKGVEARVSSGGKGFHIIVHDAGDDFYELLRMRKWLGDDIRRVMMDEARFKKNMQTQVLFWKKGERTAKVIYRREAFNKRSA